MVDVSNAESAYSGDTWEVPVDYDIDPSNSAGRPTLDNLGRWPLDRYPDGKSVKQRGHISLSRPLSTFDITAARQGPPRVRFTVPQDLDWSGRTIASS